MSFAWISRRPCKFQFARRHHLLHYDCPPALPPPPPPPCAKMIQLMQYDTLPMRVGSVEELQPGDLIFWSGEYFKPRAKRQVFDMTHVEVFIGGKTGKAVIGKPASTASSHVTVLLPWVIE